MRHRGHSTGYNTAPPPSRSPLPLIISHFLPDSFVQVLAILKLTGLDVIQLRLEHPRQCDRPCRKQEIPNMEILGLHPIGLRKFMAGSSWWISLAIVHSSGVYKGLWKVFLSA